MLNILFWLEATIEKFDKWLKGRQKAYIKKIIQCNRREIHNLTQENVYLEGLLEQFKC